MANIIHLCGNNCSGSSVMLLDTVYTCIRSLFRYERKAVSLHIMLYHIINRAIVQNEVKDVQYSKGQKWVISCLMLVFSNGKSNSHRNTAKLSSNGRNSQNLIWNTFFG